MEFTQDNKNFYIFSTGVVIHGVAYPGFPRGSAKPYGGSPTYYLTIIFRKLHENGRNFVWRRGGAQRTPPPPRSANDIDTTILFQKKTIFCVYNPELEHLFSYNDTSGYPSHIHSLSLYYPLP